MLERTHTEIYISISKYYYLLKIYVNFLFITKLNNKIKKELQLSLNIIKNMSNNYIDD